jgi:hypothetical protein
MEAEKSSRDLTMNALLVILFLLFAGILIKLLGFFIGLGINILLFALAPLIAKWSEAQGEDADTVCARAAYNALLIQEKLLKESLRESTNE